jgi:hypothetical protein
MALNDLNGMLQDTAFRLEERMQHKLVKKLVALLNDKNSEVQNMAVQWLV